MLYNLANLFRTLHRLTGIGAFRDIASSMSSAARTARDVESAKRSAERVSNDVSRMKDKVTGTDD